MAQSAFSQDNSSIWVGVEPVNFGIGRCGDEDQKDQGGSMIEDHSVPSICFNQHTVEEEILPKDIPDKHAKGL